MCDCCGNEMTWLVSFYSQTITQQSRRLANAVNPIENLLPGYISQRAGARNNHATITPACQCSKSNGKQAPGPFFAARRPPQQSCNNHAALPMRKAQWEMSSRAIFRSAPVPADKRPSRSQGFWSGSARPADNHPVPWPRRRPGPSQKGHSWREGSPGGAPTRLLERVSLARRQSPRNRHATIMRPCRCGRHTGKSAPGLYFAVRRCPLPSAQQPSSRGFPNGSRRPVDNHPVPCPRRRPGPSQKGHIWGA